MNESDPEGGERGNLRTYKHTRGREVARSERGLGEGSIKAPSWSAEWERRVGEPAGYWGLSREALSSVVYKEIRGSGSSR